MYNKLKRNLFMKRYVVYITHYTGTKLPKWYIGSSYESKVLNGYNGSVKSKKWKKIYDQERKDNKHLFKTKILSYYETKEEALIEELRLQKMHAVVKSKKYFNESYATVNGCFGRDVSGELNPNFNKRWSEEQKIAAAKKMIGTKRSEESKTKQSISISGENHWNFGKESFINGKTYEEYHGKEKAKEIKKKLSNKLTGRIIKQSSIDKMKNSDYHSANTYEERFGVEKAKEIKLKIGKNGAENSRAAKWLLISPDGEEFKAHGNINIIIKNNNLSISTIKGNVNKGKIKMKNANNKHNNWELIKV